MKIIDKIKSANNACLILQGGGMRGAYTTGAAMALNDQGLIGEFKHIVGESAGAMVGAYCLSNQIEEDFGGSIFVDHMTNDKFVNPKKFPRILDIGYAVHVIKHVKPLHYSDAAASQQTLHVAVTNATTLEPHVITSKDPNYIKALEATISVPIIYNKTVEINGEQYMDGGVSHSVPYDYARSLDCDLYVIVLTNPLRHRYKDARIKTVMANNRFVKNIYPASLLEKLEGMDEAYNKTLNKIEVDSHNYDNVEALFPSNQDRLVAMLDTRYDKVVACRKLGYEDAQFFLSQDEGPKPHGNVH